MVLEILKAEIIKLKARQRAIREWVYNKDFQLESRVIDKNIEYLESEISNIQKSK